MHQHPPTDSNITPRQPTFPFSNSVPRSSNDGPKIFHSFDRTCVVCTSQSDNSQLHKKNRTSWRQLSSIPPAVATSPNPQPLPTPLHPLLLTPTHHNQVYPPHETSPSHCKTLHSPQPESKASHSLSRTRRTWPLRRRTSRAARTPSMGRGRLLATARLKTWIWMGVFWS